MSGNNEAASPTIASAPLDPAFRPPPPPACLCRQVIALSAVKYHVTHEAWRGVYKPLWLAAALLNSLYSFYWDVERDWEISFFSQMGLGGWVGGRVVGCVYVCAWEGTLR